MMNALTRGILKKFEEAGSIYVGERDELGLKSGYGTLTMLDGSKYEGEWRNDL
jgi:hypothetical protein